MTLTQISYALAVRECKNFTMAAKICHVTQPTLSMQIKSLEESLGFILFDRSIQPMVITQEGESYLSQAEILMISLQRLSKEVREERLNLSKLAGVFRLGIIPTIAPSILTLFYRNFMLKYPEVRLEIVEAKTPEIIGKIQLDQLDAGIMATPLNHKNLLERVLYYEPLHIWAHPKIKIGTDIKKLPLFLLEDGHCLRHQALNYCAFENEHSKMHRLQSISSLLAMTFAHEAATLVPALFKKMAASENLILHEKNDYPVREISLVYSRLFLKEKFIDAIEEGIVENLPQEFISHKRKNRIIPPVN